MKKQSIYLATTLFVGGFIPCNGIVDNNTSITYNVYSNISSTTYYECNQIKEYMIDVLKNLDCNTFEEYNQLIKENLDKFYFENVINVTYKNKILKIFFKENSDFKCLLKGYIYKAKSTKNIQKSYFLEEIFR